MIFYDIYQDGAVNLPHDTYLHDCVVTLYGGTLSGVHTLNISLDGAFIIHPKAKLDSGTESVFNLNSITVLDGGVMRYEGVTAQNDGLVVNLEGGLVVQGGGVIEGNNIKVKGEYHCSVSNDSVLWICDRCCKMGAHKRHVKNMRLYTDYRFTDDGDDGEYE